MHFSSLIASKAARCVLAAPGKLLVDFGLRRAHGAEAGLLAARAAYLAGFGGSATVLAGKRFGVPLYGTMAHSYVQAHERRGRCIPRLRPRPSRQRHAADRHLRHRGRRAQGGRAGAAAAKRRHPRQGGAARFRRPRRARAQGARASSTRAAAATIRIFASGGLDEYELEKLSAAPIGGFGVGTSLVTSSDAPGLDCAYKLVEYAGVARRKRSEGKATWPGRKQVYRSPEGDLLALSEERHPGTPLLVPAMRGGRRVAPPEPLETIRARALAGYEQLPPALRSLRRAEPGYRVELSDALRALAAEVDRRGT